MIVLFFLLAAVVLNAAEPGEFPIAIWYGEPSDQALQDLRSLKKADFNRCILPFKESGQNLTLLREAETIGMECILCESALDRFISGSDSSFRRIDSLTQLFLRFRSFRGFLLFNQPSPNDFKSFAELADFFNGKYPQLECLTIARSLRSLDEAERRDFQNYLASLSRKIKVKQLICDNPGIFNDQPREEYFANLAALREAAQQSNRPFWAFVLLEPIGRPPSTPSAYIRMQVYSGLAFGAKGVLYYAFRSSAASSRPATMIDAEGRLSATYANCMVVNQEILHWTKLLLRCRSVGVYSAGFLPGVELLPPSQPVKKIDDPNILLGFLGSPENETFLLLVNTSFRFGSRCRVYLTDQWGGMEEIAKDHAEPYVIRFSSARDERYAELIFKAGEGKLFRLYPRQ